jgi:hypothetical protein
MTKTELDDPLEELARENEVSTKLVERLAEASLTLRSGDPVTPGEISEGLRLLDQYRALHARRFHDNLEPEARTVAMPSCFEHLDTVTRDGSTLEQRFARALESLDAYIQGATDGRTRLADELDKLTQEEYDRIRYEGDYPLSCLQTTLPGDAAGRVRAGFDQTVVEAADLEHHVDRYLAHAPRQGGTKLAIRCQRPGCSAKGQAETYPAVGGHLGIQPPAGWKAVPRPPREKDGKFVVDVDFLCPEHSKPGNPSESTPQAEGGLAPEANPDGSARTAPRVCACCDPIPGNLA